MLQAVTLVQEIVIVYQMVGHSIGLTKCGQCRSTNQQFRFLRKTSEGHLVRHTHNGMNRIMEILVMDGELTEF